MQLSSSVEIARSRVGILNSNRDFEGPFSLGDRWNTAVVGVARWWWWYGVRVVIGYSGRSRSAIPTVVILMSFRRTVEVKLTQYEPCYCRLPFRP
jgi:hypothetical protein